MRQPVALAVLEIEFHHDGPLAHAGKGRDGTVAHPVEYDVLVDLVRHDDEILVARDLGDRFELPRLEHLPGRVVRGVEDEQAGAGGGAAQLVRVETPDALAAAFPQRHEAGRQPEDRCRRRVHLMERLHHDHAVAAASEGREHCGEPLGRAEHHRRLGFRIRLEAAPASGVRGNGAPQLGQAVRVGVLVQLVATALQALEHVHQQRR